MTNEIKKMLNEISMERAILECKIAELSEEEAEKNITLLEQKLELHEAERKLLKAEAAWKEASDAYYAERNAQRSA